MENHKSFPPALTEVLLRLGKWEVLRPGVNKWTLGKGEDGEELALLSYDPGAWVPAHTHVGRETLVLLAGDQSDDNGTYGPLEPQANEPNTIHSVSSETGCLLMIHWEKPVKFV